MVLRDTFLNKIRELKYTMIDETKRVHIWKKKGGTHYIPVKKADKLEDDFVKSALAQAGLAPKEIEDFMAYHTVNK